MCLSVPSKVISIDNQTAMVEALGQTRMTSLILLDQPVQVGDYVVLGAAGAFAQEIIPESDALEAISYFKEIMSDGF